MAVRMYNNLDEISPQNIQYAESNHVYCFADGQNYNVMRAFLGKVIIKRKNGCSR